MISRSLDREFFDTSVVTVLAADLTRSGDIVRGNISAVRSLTL